MIPRTEVDFLDASTPVYRAAKDALAQPHSRYPVIRGSADDVIGFVHVQDLLDPEMANRSVRVGELSRQTLVLPWTRPLLAALADMRREGTHLAIVADEYGGTAGIVTMEDLVEELIGDIKDEYDVDEAETTRLRGGDVEVDGLLNLDDFEDETGVELPEGPTRPWPASSWPGSAACPRPATPWTSRTTGSWSARSRAPGRARAGDRRTPARGAEPGGRRRGPRGGARDPHGPGELSAGHA